MYNSEKTLAELFERTASVFGNLALNFEIIFVDDGSSDNSWSVIQQLKKENPDNIKGVRFARNYGQHNATLCGMKHATGDFILTMDDDLEFLPEDIPLLIENQKQTNSDVVYGVNRTKKIGFWRKMMTAFFRKLQLLNDKNTVRGSSFRLIKKSIANQLQQHLREFSFVDEFILWYTNNITSIDVSSGITTSKTRYKVGGLMNMSKNLVLLSSSLPLKFVTTFGFLMMLFNFLLGLIIIYRRIILAIDVKGYTSILVTLLFTSGAIIFCIGIVAEYIGKILKMSYGKPAYFESEIV